MKGQRGAPFAPTRPPRAGGDSRGRNLGGFGGLTRNLRISPCKDMAEGGLFEFDLGPDGFKLLFVFFGLFLGDAFLDVLGGAFDQILGLF